MNGEPVFVTLVTGQVVRATLTTEHPASSYGQPVPVAEDGGAFDAWMIADVRPARRLMNVSQRYGDYVPATPDDIRDVCALNGWPVPELRERPTEDAEGRDIREFVDAATGEVVLCDEWRECQDAQ